MVSAYSENTKMWAKSFAKRKSLSIFAIPNILKGGTNRLSQGGIFVPLHTARYNSGIVPPCILCNRDTALEVLCNGKGNTAFLLPKNTKPISSEMHNAGMKGLRADGSRYEESATPLSGEKSAVKTSVRGRINSLQLGEEVTFDLRKHLYTTITNTVHLLRISTSKGFVQSKINNVLTVKRTK